MVMQADVLSDLLCTLDTLILASKKFHTFEFIRFISYFYISYFCFPPL